MGPLLGTNLKHVVVNTIGLTGAEILLAECAAIPELLTLPGQNFIQSGHCLYRTHDYSGKEAELVFDSLNRHLLMRNGRCWMGLTKNMSSGERMNYPRAAHRRIFVERLGDSRDFLDCVEAYAVALYEAWGLDRPRATHVCHFGHNFVLQQRSYREFAQRVLVIDFGNEPWTWLAMISQRMTWNCVEAMKFYVIQRLILALYAKRGNAVLSVDLDRYLADRDSAMQEVRRFIGVPDPTQATAKLPGFIRFDRAHVLAIQEDAARLEEVYRFNPVCRLACTLSSWAPAFLDVAESVSMLDEYLDYWNSTAHTNFDWIGPIEQAIIDRCPMPSERAEFGQRFSEQFYHQYFDLTSDNYSEPVVKLRHGVGSLEDHLVIPRLPFFIRICLRYLEGICAGHELFTHSYLPIRDGRVYRTLRTPAYARKLDELGLRVDLERLESRIDEVEQAVRNHVGGPAWPFDSK